MATPNISNPQENPFRYWLRVLRPLLWWLLLVLLMFGYRQHQLWLARTVLVFQISLNDRLVDYDAGVLLDGVPASSGQRLPLGSHTLKITHPKADSFSTNFFAWYGNNDLGRLSLIRSRGLLVIAAKPTAVLLTIRGPEFGLTLTNTSGMTSSIPSDRYTIEAQYAHWQKTEEVYVSARQTTEHRIAPRLGVAQITCSHTNSIIQLLTTNNVPVDDGNDSLTVKDLPEGAYRVVVWHQRSHRDATLTITAGLTNCIMVEFVYGAALLETEPTGATVRDSNGQELGTTPVTLVELEPGTTDFELQKPGYEPVQVTMAVIANQTVALRTNLLSHEYVEAMNAARQYLAQADYGHAATAVINAIQAKPDDLVAKQLQRHVLGLSNLLQAKGYAKEGNYTAALQAAESALDAIPDNEEARQRMAEYRQALQDRAAKAEEVKRQEAVARRARRPVEFFQQWMSSIPNSGLFDRQVVVVKGKSADVESRLLSALTNTVPPSTLANVEHPDTELFRFRDVQMLGVGGWRRCDLIGGQSSDEEVTLVFKVFEYAYPEEFSIRAWIKANDEKDMLPIHPSRLDSTKAYLLPRRAEGVLLFHERIQAATNGTGRASVN